MEENKKKSAVLVYIGFFLGSLSYNAIAPILFMLVFNMTMTDEAMILLMITPYSYAILMVIITTIASFYLFENRHLVKHYWIATGIYLFILAATWGLALII